MRQSAVETGLPGSQTERGEIDLVALFREVGRRKWFVLLGTLAAFGLATATVNIVKPRYTGETKVFLENADNDYTRFGGRDSVRSDPPIDQDAVQSQIQIAQSRDIARVVIQKLDLGSRREFDQTIGGTDISTKIGVMLGLMTNPASISPEERVLESYADKLKVFAVAKSRVLSFEFQSRDPVIAAKASQLIAEEYIRHLEQAKRGSAKSAGSWLAATIEPLRQRVATAEAKVESFRSQNGLFQVGSNSLTTISTQQLSDLNTQLATARSQQSDLNSKAKLLREAIRQGRIFEVSEVVNNDVVRRLLESRATLRAQIAQEEQTLLPQHPRIKELRAQLTGLEEQIRSSAERTARTLDNDAKAAGAKVQAMQAEMDVQKKTNGVSSDQEVQLRGLEREAKAEREQLESYLARYRDAAVREGDNSVNASARVVSRAITPTNPSFPKKMPVVLITTLVGLFLSLFWVLIKALLSDHVYARRASDVTQMPPHMMAMYPGAMYPGAMHSNPAMMHPAQPTMPQSLMPQHGAPQPQANTPLPAAMAEPEAGKPADSDPVDVMSRTSKAMRESYERMTQSLQSGSAVAPVTAGLGASGAAPSLPAPSAHSVYAPAAALGKVHGSSLAAATMAASAALAPLPVFKDANVKEPFSESPLPVKVTSFGDVSDQIDRTSDLPPLTGIDPYNPLAEIAEVAKEIRVKGRPVPILVLSLESAEHGADTVRALERVLAIHGPSLAAVLEPELVTPAGLLAATRSLSGPIDFVVFNGGKATPEALPLCNSVSLIILVASDDLEDPRVDKVGEMLSGHDYFIVSAESTKALARV